MNRRIRCTALIALILGLAVFGWSGCTDEETGGDDNGSDTTVDVGDDGDADAGQPEDTGSQDDTDTGDEPEPTCDDIDCDGGQQCYHGACYDNCDSDLDCGGDLICNGDRCVAEDCGNVDCSEGYSCYRGRCYQACNRSEDCGGVGAGMTCRDGGCVPLHQQCEDLECYQVQCPEGESTTVTGTVTTPSGDYPLAGATVYVPSTELDPLPEGASCTTCEDLLSGDPFIQNVTDIEGKFELPNFPVAEEVSLVVQLGKWRREATVTDLEPCAENELDVEYTRLPRNQSEGNIPKIAVADGSCDDLECLMLSIGLDEDEFTPPGGSGSVHLYDGGGSGNFDSGDSYGDGPSLWNNDAAMMEYDMFLDSCDCSELTRNDIDDLGYLAFEHFLNNGGRAFMSHFQYIWMKYGTPNLQSVAGWEGAGGSGSTIRANTDHDGGEEMRDWLDYLGAINSNNEMTISDARHSVSWVDEELAKVWLYYPGGGAGFSEPGGDTPNYFSFNMPLGTEGDDACGRGVFADLHVGNWGVSSFPSGCSTGDLTDQQTALTYMIFDLSACIAPECEPLTCEDVKGKCGIHADQCGGIIECGECCLPIDETGCTEDGDCCGDLVCDGEISTCVRDD